MKKIFQTIILLLAALSLAGCAMTKVVTVPIKAAAKVVGGTADVID